MKSTPLQVEIQPEKELGYINSLRNFTFNKEDLDKTFSPFGVIKKISIINPGVKSSLGTKTAN